MEDPGMSTLALNIRMNGKQVVIVGGGAVALRKIRTLLKTGTSIRVIAKTVCPEITAMQLAETLEVTIGSYTGSNLDNASLVIAATNITQVNEQVATDARTRRILVAVADNPLAGDCTFPATMRHGDLEIAVSTGGRCPTFAADVRDVIAGHVGGEYGAILEQIAVEREKLLTNGSSSTYNTQVLRSLASRLISELTERKEPLP
jgi:precorrin-2 dehydrogenase/sirohydrochlorin ferrochelatase